MFFNIKLLVLWIDSVKYVLPPLIVFSSLRALDYSIRWEGFFFRLFWINNFNSSKFMDLNGRYIYNKYYYRILSYDKVTTSYIALDLTQQIPPLLFYSQFMFYISRWAQESLCVKSVSICRRYTREITYPSVQLSLLLIWFSLSQDESFIINNNNIIFTEIVSERLNRKNGLGYGGDCVGPPEKTLTFLAYAYLDCPAAWYLSAFSFFLSFLALH